MRDRKRTCSKKWVSKKVIKLKGDKRKEKLIKRKKEIKKTREGVISIHSKLFL